MTPRHSVLRGARRWVGVLALLLGFGTVAAPAAAAPRTLSAPDEIIIKAQPFHLVSALNTRFTLEFPASVTQAANVQFLLQRRVANRDSFRAIADKFAEAGVIDTLTVPLRRGTTSAGTTSFDVLLTTEAPARNDLYLPQPGIYPLAIRAVGDNGAVLASALTFLDRRDPAVTSAGTPVSVLGVLQSVVSHSTDGTVAIDDQTRDLVQEYIDFLGTTRAPLTLQVQPELVQALATSPEITDNLLYQSLKAALSGRSIVTSTYLPVDAAAMIHDGLSGELLEQIRLGESTLTAYLPGSVLHRATWVSTMPLDSVTVDVLRGMGFTSLLLLANAQTGLDRQAPSAVLARPSGAPNSATGVLSVDDQLSTTIDNAGNDPVRLGVRIAAEVMTLRDELVEAGTVPSDVRMVVSSTTGEVLDGASLTRAVSLLSSVSGIAMQDLGGEVAVNSRNPVVNFPSRIDRAGDSLSNTVSLARRELNAYGSMLPGDEPRRASWAGSLAAATSPDTPNPSEYVDALRSDMRRLTGAVSLVTPPSITLSSRTGSIRLQIRNDDTAVLRVRVRVSSPKVSFVTVPGETALAPGATTDVAIPVRARTNGRFSLTVNVLTPTSGLRVVSPGVIDVRVTAVAGLGQLISITLLLVLLAWWWNHWRRSHQPDDEESTVTVQ